MLPEPFTNAQALALLASSILGVLRGGVGVAANDTLGEVAEAEIRRRRITHRVRQEGLHPPNHPKDTSEPKSLEPIPLGVQGRGLCELVNGQTNFGFTPGRPTSDTIYLAEQIGERWQYPLTPAALQRLVNAYGVQPVENKVRRVVRLPPGGSDTVALRLP